MTFPTFVMESETPLVYLKLMPLMHRLNLKPGITAIQLITRSYLCDGKWKSVSLFKTNASDAQVEFEAWHHSHTTHNL